MFEKPFAGRATVTESFDNITIRIPNRKNILVILFLCVWMVGWYFGFSSAIGNLSKSGNASAFLTFWLVGWTFGGVFVVFMVSWMLFGYQLIILKRDSLMIQSNLFGLGKKRFYELNLVRKLEFNPEPEFNAFNRRNNVFMQNFKGGKIKFDYGMKTIKFASQVDEAEATMLLGKLMQSGFIKPESYN